MVQTTGTTLSKITYLILLIGIHTGFEKEDFSMHWTWWEQLPFILLSIGFREQSLMYRVFHQSQ